MIFLPNKFEKYTAALRVVMQKLIIKNGLKPKYLKNIKTIYEFEGITNNTLSYMSIEKELYELFLAVYLKRINQNQDFNFSIDVNGNYMLNRKLFIILVMNIITETNYIKLLEIKDKVIMISTFKINNKILKILKRLNCTFFTERKTNKQLIILPFLKTKNKEENFEYAYSLLQNSLSIVNLYL